VEAIGEGREVLNEEIYYLHYSLSISVIKPQINWAGHVASMEDNIYSLACMKITQVTVTLSV
jgi:hypothetical protein